MTKCYHYPFSFDIVAFLLVESKFFDTKDQLSAFDLKFKYIIIYEYKNDSHPPMVSVNRANRNAKATPFMIRVKND